MEEEIERIEAATAEEEATETEFCIKGYDYDVSVCWQLLMTLFMFLESLNLQLVHTVALNGRLKVHEYLTLSAK